MTLKTKDIRQEFVDLYNNGIICENGTVEIINASFIADEASIFGKVNHDYVKSEIEWYKSQSLSINQIPGKIPDIWKQISSKAGLVNSNYGWCIWSERNGKQFENCLQTLIKDSSSRQAVMIYIRPTMYDDAFCDGMKDFMCTFSTQFVIRNNTLHQMVFMRSNDAVFGYKNDRYWHNYVFDLMIDKLKEHYPSIEKGKLYWNAGSIHVYPRHFDLIG